LEHALGAADAPPAALQLQAHNQLGWFALVQGDFDQASASFAECLRMLQGSGDPALESDVYNNLGQLAHALRDRESARTAFERALASATASGDESRVADCLFQHGLLAYFAGTGAAAADYARRCLAIRERLGDRVGAAFAIGLLSNAAIDGGDVAGARKLLAEAMAVMHELEDSVHVAYGLEVLARLAVAERSYDRALRLAGAASGQRAALGTVHPALWQEVVDGDIELSRRIIGPERSAEAWAEGSAMTWKEAVDLGLAAPSGAEAPVPKGVGSLSRREWEIAELVARGLSNAEIATHLFIARRTAETHVQHILNKLGLSSRVEIAAWAVERRLQGDQELRT
jgi:non-specific serine/threonine protein kinase